MIESVSHYTSTKKTGLPWAPVVPSHWELRPNRAFLRRKKALVGDRHPDYALLSLTKAGVIVRDISTGKGKFSSDMGTCQEVHSGDLVFCLFDVPETPRTVGLSSHDGMITGAYTIFECSDALLAAYAELFYRAMDDRKLLSPLYSGLRNTIPPPRFLGSKTPVPPPHEQHAIVKFLDHADRRIRRYILAKQKLIALLKEDKQTIIDCAVTRGINPNVHLKPSAAMTSLGLVPENWEVRRLKSIAGIRYGLGQPPRESATGLPLIRATNVDHGRVTERDLLLVDPDDVPRTRGAFLSEDEIIVVRSGAYTADSAIIPRKYAGAVAGYDMVVTPRKAHAEFIALALLSRYLRDDQLIIASTRSAQPHLNAEELGVAVVLVPPEDEQTRIVQYVKSATTQIDATMEASEREIYLMREYRTRLIADVVTGKLDVREAAANLPDEVEEAEELPLVGDVLEGDEPS